MIEPVPYLGNDSFQHGDKDTGWGAMESKAGQVKKQTYYQQMHWQINELAQADTMAVPRGGQHREAGNVLDYFVCHTGAAVVLIIPQPAGESSSVPACAGCG